MEVITGVWMTYLVWVMTLVSMMTGAALSNLTGVWGRCWATGKSMVEVTMSVWLCPSLSGSPHFGVTHCIAWDCHAFVVWFGLCGTMWSVRLLWGPYLWGWKFGSLCLLYSNTFPSVVKTCNSGFYSSVCLCLKYTFTSGFQGWEVWKPNDGHGFQTSYCLYFKHVLGYYSIL